MYLSDGGLETFLCCPSQLRTLSDTNLMVALRAGCNDALAVLFERHNAMLSAIVRERLHDCDAEIIVKSVFEDIARTQTDFDSSRENLQQWLLKSVENKLGKPLV